MKKLRISALTLAVLMCLGLFTACRKPVPGTGFSSEKVDGSQAVSSSGGNGADVSAPPDQSQSPLPPDQSASLPDLSTPAEPDPEPEPEPEPEPDPKPEPEPDPKPEPEPEPKPAKNNKLYVLMYHHFIQEGQDYNVWMLTDTRLREDLQWLSDHGYTTVLPSDLAAGTPLPAKAVMLTFDDGYDSNYTLAYPILQEFKAKAVISVVVKNTDEQKAGALTWSMCRDMARSGLVEIGSHTYNLHKEVAGISRYEGESQEDYEARVLPDLQTSIDLIQANMGVKPLFFAYPLGYTDAWASDFLKEHFSVTATTNHGPSDISKGLYDLKRCNVSMGVPVGDILPE